jgi:uncharacterized membrane protein
MKNGILSICGLELITVVWTVPFGKDVAIPETLSTLLASMWSIVLSFKIRKNAHIQTISAAAFSS